MKQIHVQLHNDKLHKTKLIQQSAFQKSNLASTKTKTKKIIMAPVDSAASYNYFPTSYVGNEHNATSASVAVGNANGTIMNSVASDRYILN